MTYIFLLIFRWNCNNYKTIKVQFLDIFATIWNPKRLYNMCDLKAYMILKFNFLAKYS